MAIYEHGDIVTYYFVVMKDEDTSDRRIVAWTDSKDMLKFYLNFHKCKRFTVKQYTRRVEEFNDLINENRLDEIQIFNVRVRDPEKKGKTKIMQIPATETEAACIRDNSSDCFGSDINYAVINNMVFYLKDKYIEGLEDIFLLDAIKKSIYSKPNTMIDRLEFDEVMLLFRCFPSMFGI